MSTIDKALRSTSERDWFEDWFKREFHPDKTGPYIKDQLFFAVRAARAPLLDELEAKDKLNAELMEKQRLIDICQGQGLEHRIAAEKRAETAEKRIAELESREVTLPPVELVGYGDWPMFDANLVTEALRTAGINIAAAGKGE